MGTTVSGTFNLSDIIGFFYRAFGWFFNSLKSIHFSWAGRNPSLLAIIVAVFVLSLSISIVLNIIRNNTEDIFTLGKNRIKSSSKSRSEEKNS